MKKYDKDNFNFLMHCPEEQFDAWMDEASMDDIEYAMELIRQARAELLVEEIELQELAITDSTDVSDAKDILKKFKLK